MPRDRQAERWEKELSRILRPLREPEQEPPCTGRDDLFLTEASSTDPAVAREAVGLCATCRVVDWCLDVVEPHLVRFDGVAAGRVWRNGRPVPLSQVVADWHASRRQGAQPSGPRLAEGA